MPQARGGTGAAASVGGSSPWAARRPAERCAPSTRTTSLRRRWSRLADLPTPRHGLGVAALGGAVYVIGGGPKPGLFVSDANESLNVAG